MYSRQDSSQVLWIGTMVFGAAMGPSYPSIMTLAQQYITLTGRAQGFISVFASVGDSVLPILIAHVLQFDGPSPFMLGVLIMSVASTALYISTNVAGKWTVMGLEKQTGSAATILPLQSAANETKPLLSAVNRQLQQRSAN
jgi:fucose permease